LQQLLSRSRRPHRSGEWTPGRAVTFIVTLAASRCVTLAARASGMSRKSAYTLKARDSAFAAAWAAAMKAGAAAQKEPAASQSNGDKVEEVHEPPVAASRGYTSPSRIDRERRFGTLIARLRESPPLAPDATAQ